MSESTYLDEILRVVDGILRKAIGDTESAVSAIQGQVIALTTLSEDQRALLREAMQLGDAPAAAVLMQRLNELMRSNAALAEVLMPIIVSLQFQDRLRQELESLQNALGVALPRLAPDGGSGTACRDEDFWKLVATRFTSIESRATVLKAVMGEGYVYAENAVQSADDGFFL